MSSWWDADARRYRYSLPYRVFYVWTWPVARRVIFRLPSEVAHKLGIRAIRIVGWLDTIWSWCLVPVALAVIVPLALLYKLRRTKNIRDILSTEEAAEFTAKFICDYHVGAANSIWESGLTDREGRKQQAYALLRAIIELCDKETER